jgi:hypothetical protein
MGERLTGQPNEPEAHWVLASGDAERPRGHGAFRVREASNILERDLHDVWLGGLANWEARLMTYVMTKPCPVCRQQLTKQRPTDTVPCTCGKYVWPG